MGFVDSPIIVKENTIIIINGIVNREDDINWPLEQVYKLTFWGAKSPLL